MNQSVIGDNVIPTVGKNYTDYATVLAVQKALSAKGFSPNKGIDGKWGPDTQETLRSWQYESGQPVTGVIDYGVLMALGVSAPTSGGQISASAASALADATARSHAAVPSDVDMAAVASAAKVRAAETAVTAAKQRAANASTPQAAQVAQQQLAVAEQRLSEVQPSFLMRTVPGLNIEYWKVGLGLVGATALTIGIAQLVKRR